MRAMIHASGPDLGRETDSGRLRPMRRIEPGPPKSASRPKSGPETWIFAQIQVLSSHREKSSCSNFLSLVHGRRVTHPMTITPPGDAHPLRSAFQSGGFMKQVEQTHSLARQLAHRWHDVGLGRL